MREGGREVGGRGGDVEREKKMRRTMRRHRQIERGRRRRDRWIETGTQKMKKKSR